VSRESQLSPCSPPAAGSTARPQRAPHTAACRPALAAPRPRLAVRPLTPNPHESKVRLRLAPPLQGPQTPRPRAPVHTRIPGPGLLSPQSAPRPGLTGPREDAALCGGRPGSREPLDVEDQEAASATPGQAQLKVGTQNAPTTRGKSAGPPALDPTGARAPAPQSTDANRRECGESQPR
jgi:hypothetical protein